MWGTTNPTEHMQTVYRLTVKFDKEQCPQLTLMTMRKEASVKGLTLSLSRKAWMDLNCVRGGILGYEWYNPCLDITYNGNGERATEDESLREEMVDGRLVFLKMGGCLLDRHGVDLYYILVCVDARAGSSTDTRSMAHTHHPINAGGNQSRY